MGENDKLTRALAEVNTHYELYIKSEEICKGLKRENELLQRALRQKDEDMQTGLNRSFSQSQAEEIEKLKTILKEKNAEVERYLKNEGKFLMVLAENEKLNDIVVQRSSEFELAKTSWSETERSLRQEIYTMTQDFENKIQRLLEENENMEKLLKRFQKDNEQLRTQQPATFGESRILGI